LHDSLVTVPIALITAWRSSLSQQMAGPGIKIGIIQIILTGNDKINFMKEK
jgi:hypothetical protein